MTDPVTDPVTDICNNCGSEGALECLNQAQANRSLCMTSDSQPLQGNEFKHLLCARCACVQITYDPADALKQHYARDYDVSDVVQNNLVVTDGKAAPKKTAMTEFLLSNLRDEKLDVQRILEVACGKGELIGCLQAEYESALCIGIDPSPDVPSTTNANDGQVRFVQAFFEEEVIPARDFDVIVAHGFLNRSPTIPELQKMHRLIRDGGLLSLEVMVLEDSPHTPAIWDHSHMYTLNTFKAWLSYVGFSVVAEYNNHTTIQLIARAQSPDSASLPVSTANVERARVLFAQYESFWRNVETALFELKASAQPYYLFGAGMFSGIVYGLLGNLDKFEAVVDEVRAGSTFWGKAVVSLQEAAKTGGTVVICTRPHYAKVIAEKVREVGLSELTLGD